MPFFGEDEQQGLVEGAFTNKTIVYHSEDLFFPSKFWHGTCSLVDTPGHIIQWGHATAPSQQEVSKCRWEHLKGNLDSVDPLSKVPLHLSLHLWLCDAPSLRLWCGERAHSECWWPFLSSQLGFLGLPCCVSNRYFCHLWSNQASGTWSWHHISPICYK